ncbi:MAG: hypothetical protein ACOCWQ_05410 [Nanoarchaeota archaeon]
MNEDVRQDILAVLTKAQVALQDRDEVILSQISNETIHNASIYQDDLSIDVAIAMYALSKILGRKKDDKSAFFSACEKLIGKAYAELRTGSLEDYHTTMHEVLRTIKQADRKMSLYIQHVLDQARLKKSAKLYDHGISLAQSASKLGVSQWQLYSYIGKTSMDDAPKSSVRNMKKRLAFTRSLFKGGVR